MVIKDFFQGVRKLVKNREESKDISKNVDSKDNDSTVSDLENNYQKSQSPTQSVAKAPLSIFNYQEMPEDQRREFFDMFFVVRPSFSKDIPHADFLAEVSNKTAVKIWNEIFGNEKLFKSDSLALDSIVLCMYFCLYNQIIKETKHGLEASFLFKKTMEEIERNGYHFLSLLIPEMRGFENVFSIKTNSDGAVTVETKDNENSNDKSDVKKRRHNK